MVNIRSFCLYCKSLFSSKNNVLNDHTFVQATQKCNQYFMLGFVCVINKAELIAYLYLLSSLPDPIYIYIYIYIYTPHTTTLVSQCTPYLHQFLLDSYYYYFFFYIFTIYYHSYPTSFASPASIHGFIFAQFSITKQLKFIHRT